MSISHSKDSPGPSGFESVVIGGTYVDHIFTTKAEIVTDTTVEIDGRSQLLGGPGISLALSLSRLGTLVALSTAIGECKESAEAAELLAADGAILLGSVVPDGILDNSDLYVTPQRRRVVFNSHALSLTVNHLPIVGAFLPTAKLVLVASPTPVEVGEKIFEVAPPEALKVALLHSAQARAVASGQNGIIAKADLVIASYSDGLLMDRELRTNRNGYTVLTRGTEGVTLLLADSDKELHIDQPEKVVDGNENGAGEAFCAALCAYLIRLRKPSLPLTEDSLRSASVFAQSYAAAHVRAGGNLSFPYSRPV